MISLSRYGVLVALAALFSCDIIQDPPENEVVEVVYSVPSTGNSDVPIDSAVEIYLSGHVDGRTVRPDTIKVVSGSVWSWGQPVYDPVDRKIRLLPRSELRRNLLYTVISDEGLKELDGDEIEPGVLTYFWTGDWKLEDEAYLDEENPVLLEKNIHPLFLKSCHSCHQGGPGAFNLDFSSAESISETLTGKKSYQWPDWYLVVPGDPGSSYLMYKLTGGERVPGEKMPPVPELEPGMEQIRLISDWIASGAN